MSARRRLSVLSLITLLCLCSGVLSAAGRPEIVIQRLDRAPRLEEFLGMQPPADLAGQLTVVENFVQRVPEDGAPASQRTQVYLGYDQSALYAIFVAFDDEPEKVRAHMARRENFFGDDIVEIQLDTFHDEQRAFSFICNPLGIQWDAIWTEGSGDNFDSSWDTVWQSSGKRTDSGFVVLMEIPFKSLRFSQDDEQTWGIVLARDLLRTDENTFWPPITAHIEGRLNQAATMRGLKGISSGRNIWLIPYTTARRFSLLDPDADPAAYQRESFDADAGLDAKFVFKDSLSLDLTANPDFAQIESDQPQVTVNQRFENFFPEKRPFFLENAGYFSTPTNLLFTRRIEDPRVGARLTGKLGNYSLGAMLVDDEAPGKQYAAGDPRHGKRASIGAFRVQRDILSQSQIGLLYVSREFSGDSNKVGGIDGRIKLGEHWVSSFHATQSKTREENVEGEEEDTAYQLIFNRAGHSFSSHLHYREVGPDFNAAVGFVPRRDIRDVHQISGYTFWREGPKLISWEPEIFAQEIWNHDGTRVDWVVSPGLDLTFRRQTQLEFRYSNGVERLLVSEFPQLGQDRDFPTSEMRIEFRSHPISAFNGRVEVSQRETINYRPAGTEPQRPADATGAEFQLTLLPGDAHQWETTYLYTRLEDELSGRDIFTNQIVRTRWNWQINKMLSLRAILQYNDTDPNPDLTDLERIKNINGDFLVTYLVNPWTALYVGYNSNYQNLAILEPRSGFRENLATRQDDYINDSHQIFFKLSYLFRL
jgi:hypothetical protein